MVTQNLRLKVLKIVSRKIETLPYITNKDNNNRYHKYKHILDVIIRGLGY